MVVESVRWWWRRRWWESWWCSWQPLKGAEKGAGVTGSAEQDAGGGYRQSTLQPPPHACMHRGISPPTSSRSLCRRRRYTGRNKKVKLRCKSRAVPRGRHLYACRTSPPSFPHTSRSLCQKWQWCASCFTSILCLCCCFVDCVMCVTDALCVVWLCRWWQLLLPPQPWRPA